GYSKEWISQHVFSYRKSRLLHEGINAATQEISRRFQELRTQRPEQPVFAIPNPDAVTSKVYQLSSVQKIDYQEVVATQTISEQAESKLSLTREKLDLILNSTDHSP